MNRSPLETFISEQCFAVSGESIEFALFYKQFIEWLPMEQRYNWRKGVVLDEIKQRFPYGCGNANKRMIGNLSFENKTPDPNARALVVHEGRLIKK